MAKMRKFSDGGGTGLKKETFGEAFKRNRARGEKTFEYNGEKFTTEYKEEKDAREAKEKDKKAAERKGVTALRPSDDEIRDIKSKQSGVTALRPSDDEIKDIKEKQAGRVPKASAAEMERRNKREKEQALESVHPENYAFGAGLARKGISSLATKGASKDVAKRIEPTLNAPKASGAQKFAVSEARKKASKEPAQRAIEAQRKAARREADRTGEGRDYSEYKKGGKVKKMASGGMARSASSRADGCAIRGKTRA